MPINQDQCTIIRVHGLAQETNVVGTHAGTPRNFAATAAVMLGSNDRYVLACGLTATTYS